jgi:hypothetical protein
MVHHISLFKLKPGVTTEKLEDMIRKSRSQLLKIPEVMNIRSGRNIDLDSEWIFFVSMDIESTDKLAMCQEDPVYVKFIEEVVKPNATETLELDYETEPGKDIKYS